MTVCVLSLMYNVVFGLVGDACTWEPNVQFFWTIQPVAALHHEPAEYYRL
jgi:hypothetical protein